MNIIRLAYLRMIIREVDVDKAFIFPSFKKKDEEAEALNRELNSKS